MSALTQRFRELHAAGTFVMPNPFDVGSARLLAALGFPALASTSAGFAASLGRLDMSVQRDELLAHVAALSAATDLPLNVDAERCFGDSPGAVAETVSAICAAGAAGCSIEDWNPATNAIDDRATAVARVAAASAAAHAADVVLTARCENLLHGVLDLDDTIERLQAYRDAGADVVYAPGLVDLGEIERVVAAVGVPVNVLLFPAGPSVAQLADTGVRRVSVGSGLSTVAYGALIDAAVGLRDNGVLPSSPTLDRKTVVRAWARH